MSHAAHACARASARTGPLRSSLRPTAPTAASAACARTPIFLNAHLDTVPPSGPIEPVVGEDGVVRNGRDTILGADNKAAVVAMLAAVRDLIAGGRPHAGIELVFTPMEEVGLQGAKRFDVSRLA